MKKQFMKSVLKPYLFILLVALSFCSCSNDYHDVDMDVFKPIPLEIEGIDTKQLNKFECTSDIPASGVDFKVKNENSNGFVSSVLIDKKPAFPRILQLPNDGSSHVEGEWGYIDYVTEKAPFEIDIHFGANTSGQQREIEITIGGWRYYSIITLIQTAE